MTDEITPIASDGKGSIPLTEAEYDADFAPALMDIMRRLSERGADMLCHVSFSEEGGETGYGLSMHCPNPTAVQRIVHRAMTCRGNLDAMMIGLARDHKSGLIDGSQSIALSRFIGGSND